MALGDTIKDIRCKRGLNQSELAKKCSLSQTYLSQIEKSRRICTLEVIKTIAHNLSIPYEVLIFLSMDVDDIYKTPHEQLTIKTQQSTLRLIHVL